MRVSTKTFRYHVPLTTTRWRGDSLSYGARIRDGPPRRRWRKTFVYTNAAAYWLITAAASQRPFGLQCRTRERARKYRVAGPVRARQIKTLGRAVRRGLWLFFGISRVSHFGYCPSANIVTFKPPRSGRLSNTGKKTEKLVSRTVRDNKWPRRIEIETETMNGPAFTNYGGGDGPSVPGRRNHPYARPT